jgi:hypothetical protein
VKSKILVLKLLSSETSVIISDHLSDCLTENGLVGKVVGLCVDNTNSNLVLVKGQNNVSTKLHKTLSYGLIGVRCTGHMFNNTV